MQPEESQILDRLRQQEPTALDDLITLTGSRAYRLAELVLGGAGDHRDAEEVVSDAFARVWREAEAFDPARGTLLAWVLMLTRYAALDRRRSLLRRLRTPAGEARVISLSVAPEPKAPSTPEDEAIRAQDRSLVQRALSLLSPPERELIIRRYFLEESIIDLAETTGLARGTLETRLWRARGRLKALMQESEVRADGR